MRNRLLQSLLLLTIVAVGAGALTAQTRPSPNTSVTVEGAAGGTSSQDDAAFTIGSEGSITPGGFLVDDTTPDSADEGDVGVARMSATRILYNALANAAGSLFATIRDTGSNDSLNVAITDASGNQITSFGGGTQYAVDAALGSTPTGTLAVAIRDDALATLTPVEGDAVGLRVDSTGALWVSGAISCSNCTGSGASEVDDAAFTVGSDSGAPISGLADETSPDSVDEGDTGLLRMTLARILKVTLTDADGDALSIGNDYAEDASHTSGDSGPLVLGVRRDTLASSTATDGEYASLNLNASGALWTAPAPSTNGGLSTFVSSDLDETEEDVKASAGQIYAMWVTNTSTATRFVRCYNDSATNVTVGTTARVFEIGIPGNATDDIAAHLSAGGFGVTFSTAISWAATTGAGASDTGAPGAGDIIVTVFYK